MKIDQYMKGVRAAAPATEKTASAVTVDASKTSEGSTLLNALNAALETTKVASVNASNPASDLVKIANELAEVEKQAAAKEAALMGTAFADAAIARLTDWQKTAGLHAPVAAIPGTDVTSIQKLASASGYAQAVQDMEKQAEEDYVNGYNETVTAFHKVATAQFIHGTLSARRHIQAASR